MYVGFGGGGRGRESLVTDSVYYDVRNAQWNKN